MTLTPDFRIKEIVIIVDNYLNSLFHVVKTNDIMYTLQSMVTTTFTCMLGVGVIRVFSTPPSRVTPDHWASSSGAFRYGKMRGAFFLYLFRTLALAFGFGAGVTS